MRCLFVVAAAPVLFSATAAVSQSVTTIGSSAAQACYEAARDRQAALPDLDRCEQALKGVLSPSDLVATHVNRGIVRALRAEYREALLDYDRAILLDPGKAEAYLNKGLLLLRMPKSDREAIEAINAAIAEKTTKPALAYLARGIAHERLGDVRAAFRDYQRAAMLDPKWDLPARELSRFRRKS